MATRSKIVDLPEALQAEIARLLAGGVTYKRIEEHLRALGADVSKSAVGRHSQKLRQKAEARERMEILAANYVAGTDGMTDGDITNACAAMVGGLLLQIGAKAGEGEALTFTSAEVRDLSRAFESIGKGRKANVDAQVVENTLKATAEEATQAPGGAVVLEVQFVDAPPRPENSAANVGENTLPPQVGNAAEQ